MNQIAKTPEPPYYAVVFTSVRTATDEGYADTARKMMALASNQPGFLGVASVRQDGGHWQVEKPRRASAGAETRPR